MRPEPHFFVPTSVEETVGLLSTPGSVAVAGGTWLAPQLKDRSVQPDSLVYLGRVPELRAERRDGGALQLGSCLTLQQLASSAQVSARTPLLGRVAGKIANPRIRSVATIGGSVALGDGRQDLLAVLLALGAKVQIQGPHGAREVSLDRLYDESGQALAAGELITGLVVAAEAARRVVYLRFAPGSAQDYLTVGVAVALTFGSDGVVSDARVALAGVAPRTILPAACAQQLVGRQLLPESIAAAADAAAEACTPRADRLGSADYKRAMARVWTRRALEGVGGPFAG
jgi:carbon-monoxide dehydrogenase medium subunit